MEIKMEIKDIVSLVLQNRFEQALRLLPETPFYWQKRDEKNVELLLLISLIKAKLGKSTDDHIKDIAFALSDDYSDYLKMYSNRFAPFFKDSEYLVTENDEYNVIKIKLNDYTILSSNDILDLGVKKAKIEISYYEWDMAIKSLEKLDILSEEEDLPISNVQNVQELLHFCKQNRTHK